MYTCDTQEASTVGIDKIIKPQRQPEGTSVRIPSRIPSGRENLHIWISLADTRHREKQQLNLGVLGQRFFSLSERRTHT
jgi:hypothetical protein